MAEENPQPRSEEIRQRALDKRKHEDADGSEELKPKQKQKRKSRGPSKILAQEKMRKAVELRKAGATYDSIAQMVGYSDASGARKAVERAMKQMIQEPALEMKTIQIERCNHMLMTLWPKVQQGDERAIDSSLRIMDKIDRYMGTEQAQKIDINATHTNAVLVIDGDKDDYIAAMKRLVGIGPDGANMEITAGPEDENIVDALVVEEHPGDVTVEAATPDLAVEPTQGIVEEPPKRWNFSVDPYQGEPT